VRCVTKGIRGDLSAQRWRLAIQASAAAVAHRAPAAISIASGRPGSPITAFLARWDITENAALSEKAEPIEPIDAVEKAQPADPTEPIERNDPTEPTESAEPFDAMERNESSDQSDSEEESSRN